MCKLLKKLDPNAALTLLDAEVLSIEEFVDFAHAREFDLDGVTLASFRGDEVDDGDLARVLAGARIADRFHDAKAIVESLEIPEPVFRRPPGTYARLWTALETVPAIFDDLRIDCRIEGEVIVLARRFDDEHAHGTVFRDGSAEIWGYMGLKLEERIRRFLGMDPGACKRCLGGHASHVSCDSYAALWERYREAAEQLPDPVETFVPSDKIQFGSMAIPERIVRAGTLRDALEHGSSASLQGLPVCESSFDDLDLFLATRDFPNSTQRLLEMLVTADALGLDEDTDDLVEIVVSIAPWKFLIDPETFARATTNRTAAQALPISMPRDDPLDEVVQAILANDRDRLCAVLATLTGRDDEVCIRSILLHAKLANFAGRGEAFRAFLEAGFDMREWVCDLETYEINRASGTLDTRTVQTALMSDWGLEVGLRDATGQEFDVEFFDDCNTANCARLLWFILDGRFDETFESTDELVTKGICRYEYAHNLAFLVRGLLDAGVLVPDLDTHVFRTHSDYNMALMLEVKEYMDLLVREPADVRRALRRAPHVARRLPVLKTEFLVQPAIPFFKERRYAFAARDVAHLLSMPNEGLFAKDMQFAWPEGVRPEDVVKEISEDDAHIALDNAVRLRDNNNMRRVMEILAARGVRLPIARKEYVVAFFEPYDHDCLRVLFS